MAQELQELRDKFVGKRIRVNNISELFEGKLGVVTSINEHGNAVVKLDNFRTETTFYPKKLEIVSGIKKDNRLIRWLKSK